MSRLGVGIDGSLVIIYFRQVLQSVRIQSVSFTRIHSVRFTKLDYLKAVQSTSTRAHLTIITNKINIFVELK